MNERRLRLTESDLEAALRDVGTHLVYPPTIDLGAGVRARIMRHADAGVAPALWPPRLAVVPLLITVALLALVTLAFQPVGTQAAEALGLRGLVIFRGAATPSPTARPSPTTSATPTSATPSGVLSDAHRVASVDAASREAGFAVSVPATLGTPDEVYVRSASGDTEVFLVYAPSADIPASGQTGIGVLITEARGGFEYPLLGKIAGPGTKVQQVTVNGSPAVWVEGLHQFFYRTANGGFVQDSIRLSGNVLIWNKGDLLIRVEADVPQDRAVRVAASMP